jgi:hypothetical protein
LSLQRCEGANLESVLEEVRARFGDTVTIVEANRLRKGGVGGFFAKERYEVVVDIVDDEEPDGPTELPAEYGMQATEDFCDRLLSMADGVSDLEPPASTLSTERPTFNAVLDSITRHMEADGPELLEPPGRRLFMRRSSTAPAASHEPPAASPLGGAAASAPVAPTPTPAVAAPPASPATTLTAPFASPTTFAAPAAAPMAAGGPLPDVELASVRPQVTVPVRPPVPEPKPGIDNRALARIGLPEDLRRA